MYIKWGRHCTQQNQCPGEKSPTDITHSSPVPAFTLLSLTMIIKVSPLDHEFFTIFSNGCIYCAFILLQVKDAAAVKNQPHSFTEPFTSCTMSHSYRPHWQFTSGGAVAVGFILTAWSKTAALMVSLQIPSQQCMLWWKSYVCTKSSRFQTAESTESRQWWRAKLTNW